MKMNPWLRTTLLLTLSLPAVHAKYTSGNQQCRSTLQLRTSCAGVLHCRSLPTYFKLLYLLNHSPSLSHPYISFKITECRIFWWLIVHSHANCLLHTVTKSCTRGTACWQSASQFRKSGKCSKLSENWTKTRDLSAKWKLVCSWHVTNFQTTYYGFIHKRFNKYSYSTDPSGCLAPVAFSLQVAAWHQ